MQARFRRKLSMVDRVLLYDKEYPSTDPGYTGVMARLEQLSARGAELLAMEVDGDSGERLATQRRTEVRRNLSGMLRHLDRVGTAATALERPELKGKFDAPESNLTNRNYLATARQLLAVATEHQELLLKFSLGEGFIESLDKLIEEFSEMGKAASTSRSRHVGARGELPTIAAEGTYLVHVLDGFNRNRFAPGSAQLAAWESATNIFGPIARTKREQETAVEVEALQEGAGQALLAPPSDQAAA